MDIQSQTLRWETDFVSGIFSKWLDQKGKERPCKDIADGGDQILKYLFNAPHPAHDL